MDRKEQLKWLQRVQGLEPIWRCTYDGGRSEQRFTLGELWVYVTRMHGKFYKCSVYNTDTGEWTLGE